MAKRKRVDRMFEVVEISKPKEEGPDRWEFTVEWKGQRARTSGQQYEYLTTANAHLWDLARRLGFGDEHERALGGRLIQFFSRKKLPVEGTFTVRIAKEDGTTLCLPVWTTRDSPCFTMQKDSVKSQQWHWVTPALEDARRHPAYILAIVPPSHSEETHGTQHTEVVLLWATPPEASREVEYCCSEDVAVVRLDQVGDAIHPRVAGIDDNENAAAEEVPIFDSSVLKLGTMLTSHSKSEPLDVTLCEGNERFKACERDHRYDQLCSSGQSSPSPRGEREARILAPKSYRRAGLMKKPAKYR